jgi:hypothetical protein
MRVLETGKLQLFLAFCARASRVNIHDTEDIRDADACISCRFFDVTISDFVKGN